jgi:hypothetical protein
MDTEPTIKNFMVTSLPAILTIVVIFLIVMPKIREGRVVDEQVVGGDSDEHGCILTAGYSWNREAGACVREWEIKNESERVATKKAVEHLGWQNDATLIEIVSLECPGCFVVKIQRNSTSERKEVSINNWNVE